MDASAATAGRLLAWLLDQEGPVTRPAVALALGLSRPTVFAAMDRLESAHLVEIVGVDSGRPGRSAALYRVSRDAGLVGAIDIGGSNIRVAVADARGEVLATRTEATRSAPSAAVITQAIDLLAAALAEADSRRPLTSVCMSVPGVVDVDGRMVRFATNLGQPEAHDFATPVHEAFGCPVHLDNNVNLAAIGEQWLGAGRDLGTFAVVAVGAGVGAGIVYDGQVLRGAHRAAGEIAFLPSPGGLKAIDPHAHDPAGGIRLLEAARADTTWASAPPATVQELFERAAAGEPAAVALFENECEQIARVIASVCAVIDPEAVILTGGVGANAAFIARLREHMRVLALFPPELVASHLAERASLMGALRTAADARKAALLQAVADESVWEQAKGLANA